MGTRISDVIDMLDLAMADRGAVRLTDLDDARASAEFLRGHLSASDTPVVEP